MNIIRDRKMPPTPSIACRGSTPSVSFDGRSGQSKLLGKRARMVKMCPHVKPGGGVCGLEANHCMCECLLCHKLMRARKCCGARLLDGTLCPWGADRSPEISSPEEEVCVVPPRPALPTDLAAFRASIDQRIGGGLGLPDQRIGSGLCLPNLEPGGPHWLSYHFPRKRTPPKKKADANFEFTPSTSPAAAAVVVSTPYPRSTN